VDLFVGGRLVPWRYGETPQSVLLINDGRGYFTDQTVWRAPDLRQVGMVTDAAWADLDGDGRLDLIVVGEWMPITIFRNMGQGRLERLSIPPLDSLKGLWHRLVVADFNGNGSPDLVVTNLGLNTPLKASPEAPLVLWAKDFDQNGFFDHILTRREGVRHRPFTLLSELRSQLPYFAQRIPSHAAYAQMMLEDIFRPQELEGALVLEVTELQSMYIENLGDWQFRPRPLPFEAQWAPLYGLLPIDVDGDGHLDLLAGGNFRWAQTGIGLMEATYGLWLKGDGQGNFTAVLPRDSGFFVSGEVRDLRLLRPADQPPLILVALNDAAPRFFQLRR